MRVLVTPDRVEVGDGNAVEINVTVHNTGMLIGGYHLRVLGADPSWVTLGAENLSLFPDASETVRAVVRLPPGVAAGERRMAVQVRELTPPQAISIADIVLTVPAVESLRVALSPMTVVGGRSGTFGVVLENTGNTPVVAQLAGTDAEDVMRFAFEPDVVTLAPGDQAITDLRATGPRRWFGQPVVRTFGIGLRPLLPPAPPEHSGPPASEEPLATGTLLQKARLSRGLLSLLSLLFAATVFATVLTIALTALVGQSAADRDLAIQVAAAQNTDGLAGTSALGGSVVLLTSGDPVPGVSVELFDAAATTTPIANAATGDDGTWTIDNLPAGAYKFRVRGAGFAEIWYENALTAAEAKEVVLNLGQQIRDLKVTLGGLPASVSGEVVGSDVAGAVLSVQVPVEFLPADPAAVADNEAAASDLTPAGAVLRTVPIGSDGLFEITDIASPAVYDLVVTKTGFATATERVDLTGGESRSGVQIRLRTGDGLISGSVTGPDGVLGGAVITATTGTTTAETVSLTEGDIGGFTLRGLVTPATYSVTVTSPGFSPQTTSVSLADGQTLTGVQLAVARSAGSLNGIVSTVPGNEPAAGVTVSVTAGTDTVETVTQSTGDVGRWTVAGLAIPSRYTVTFSRADLESQTVAVTLDAAGQLSSGSGVGPDGITVAMTSAFAEVSGVVSQRSPDGRTQPVGEAVITLSSGTDEYSVISASEPASQVGAFQVGGVAPGTYTLSASRRGTSPTSVIVTVAAGESRQFNPVLIPPASITGKVTDQLGREVAGLEVVLFKASEYPAQPAQQTTTDAVGGYSFADVDAPQAYVVEVRSRTQGALGSATLVLNASQAAVLNISVGAPAASSSPVPVRQPVPGPTTTVTQSAPAPPRPAAPTPAVGSTPTTQAGPTAQAAPSRTAAPTSATTTPTAALTTPAMTAAQVLGMTP